MPPGLCLCYTHLISLPRRLFVLSSFRPLVFCNNASCVPSDSPRSPLERCDVNFEGSLTRQRCIDSLNCIYQDALTYIPEQHAISPFPHCFPTSPSTWLYFQMAGYFGGAMQTVPLFILDCVFNFVAQRGDVCIMQKARNISW